MESVCCARMSIDHGFGVIEEHCAHISHVDKRPAFRLHEICFRDRADN